MSVTEHELTLPLSHEAAQKLNLGDFVYLTGEIFATAGLPTHDRLLKCLEGAEPLPFDMSGSALFHLGSLNEEAEDGSLSIVYMNPTTSTRFNRHMPRLIPGLGLRATGGKGGLDAACARAMAENGCVYLSFLGGGAPIITAGIRKVTGIGWPEMISHYRIARIEVERLGPLTVGIDARGNSIYDRTSKESLEKRASILDAMRAERDSFEA
ncbi:fumarate hydratase C-terminal domain-containing protein [Roseibium marinum]|uniref:Fumarate hydratase subunit beta n=1 Tax=Roseibium marinum TaxID=281252 RepID=A0A2S3UX82_9HYPH|nr:fumarate hydratase C-terminal domain-containing protein [Roseibium marinum]POF32190.1 fumarate hydratase subunit beta [Roseibium marinum]